MPLDVTLTLHLSDDDMSSLITRWISTIEVHRAVVETDSVETEPAEAEPAEAVPAIPNGLVGKFVMIRAYTSNPDADSSLDGAYAVIGQSNNAINAIQAEVGEGASLVWRFPADKYFVQSSWGSREEVVDFAKRLVHWGVRAQSLRPDAAKKVGRHGKHLLCILGEDA